MLSGVDQGTKTITVKAQKIIESNKIKKKKNIFFLVLTGTNLSKEHCRYRSSPLGKTGPCQITENSAILVREKKNE